MKNNILLFLLPFVLVACHDKNESNPPKVITYGYEMLTDATVACVGYITNDGNATITDRGICYCQNSAAAVDMQYASRISAGEGTGEFKVTLPPLTKGVEYVYCAYATNAGGTSYGSRKTFTLPADISVATSVNDFIGTYTATVTNKGLKTTETWKNVQVVISNTGAVQVTNLGTKNVSGWPVLNISAVGHYDDTHHCVILNDAEYNPVANKVTITSGSSKIVCYAIFTPVCELVKDDQPTLQKLFYEQDMGEVALCKLSDGTLVLRPSPNREAYGRKYTSFTFILYNTNTWNILTNVSCYTDLVLRK